MHIIILHDMDDYVECLIFLKVVFLTHLSQLPIGYVWFLK